jgi:hypothetical protein
MRDYCFPSQCLLGIRQTGSSIQRNGIFRTRTTYITGKVQEYEYLILWLEMIYHLNSVSSEGSVLSFRRIEWNDTAEERNIKPGSYQVGKVVLFDFGCRLEQFFVLKMHGNTFRAIHGL